MFDSLPSLSGTTVTATDGLIGNARANSGAGYEGTLQELSVLGGEQLFVQIDVTHAIGSVKVDAASGGFAARPSGAEDVYKIYAESFSSPEQLQNLLQEDKGKVGALIGSP